MQAFLLGPDNIQESKNKYDQYQFKTKGHYAGEPGKS